MYALAALVFLFYLFHVPVFIALCASPGAFGVGISALSPGSAYRKAEEFALNGRARKRKDRKKPDFSDMRRLFRYLIKRVAIGGVTITGTVFLYDAMVTSLIAGFLKALSCAFPAYVQVNVVPDYSGMRTNIECAGMATVKLGHIIVMAVKYAYMTQGKRGEEHGQASD